MWVYLYWMWVYCAFSIKAYKCRCFLLQHAEIMLQHVKHNFVACLRYVSSMLGRVWCILAPSAVCILREHESSYPENVLILDFSVLSCTTQPSTLHIARYSNKPYFNILFLATVKSKINSFLSLNSFKHHVLAPPPFLFFSAMTVKWGLEVSPIL